jgi:hypothetical protein
MADANASPTFVAAIRRINFSPLEYPAILAQIRLPTTTTLATEQFSQVCRTLTDLGENHRG